MPTKDQINEALRAVIDPDSGLDVPAGCVSLSGEQALAFVRVRNIDPSADYGRIARQQFFVQLVMNKLLSAGTLLNPVKVVQLVGIGAGNVKTDSGLGTATMEKLALQLRSFGPNDLDFRVVPSRAQYVGDASYAVSYAGQSVALFDAIKNGTPLPDYGRQGTALTPSNVQTTVLNGTATPGLATQAEADLKAAGYPVVATGNAGSTSYAATVVYYNPGSLDKASLLAQVYGRATVAPLPPQIQASGDAVVAPSVTRRLLERFVGTGEPPLAPAVAVDVLTDREREVLALLARGLSNAEIAAAIYVGEGTVKTHVSRVLAKLGLRDRVQAVVYAYESGLVHAGARSTGKRPDGPS